MGGMRGSSGPGSHIYVYIYIYMYTRQCKYVVVLWGLAWRPSWWVHRSALAFRRAPQMTTHRPRFEVWLVMVYRQLVPSKQCSNYFSFSRILENPRDACRMARSSSAAG